MSTAYRSTDPAVLDAWHAYRAAVEANREARSGLSYAVGRNLMVNRSGFGHGTRVVGFERFESDKDGDVLHRQGSLVVSSRRGQHHGLVVPNLRRKAGKEFAEKLAALRSPELDLPGMPAFHIGGDGDTVGISSHAPALWEHEGVAFAFWNCDGAPVKEQWEKIPLSSYYAAYEAYTAAQAAAVVAGATP